MNDPWAQISRAFDLDEARAELCGHIFDARLVHLFFDGRVDRLRLTGDSKRGEAGRWIIRTFDFDGAEALRECSGDFFAVTGGPDTGAVDATAATIGVNALGDEIDVLRPVIHD